MNTSIFYKKPFFCVWRTAILFLLCFPLGLSAQSEHNFEVTRQLDIFNTLYRQLDLQYVDSLDAKKHIDQTIRSLLQQLDPYTEYYAQEKRSELRQLATGKYAGIGSPIFFRRQLRRCVFANPYEGMPASNAGVRTGDIILSVNGRNFPEYTGEQPQEYSTKVTEALRGEAGSTFELIVRRPGEKRPIKFRITRETIALPNITLSKLYPNGIGYVDLSQYTEHTAEELRAAIFSLMKQGATSLVLDLRGNGGGVVSEAVKIVNFFLPKGKEVLSMRGKGQLVNQTYRTEAEPIAPRLPLVVLVDYGTASAAEITAGALQDYDRAVIIGERTFGKGLVQQPLALPHSAMAKVTVAKYYIPSGRCLQAYDFKHRNAAGQPRHLPDSLTKEYRTTTGRIVRDGGGILPDQIVKEDSISPLLADLAASDVLFDFVVQYRQTHSAIDLPETFTLSAADYTAFVDYCKEQKYSFKSGSSQLLKAFRELLTADGYAKRVAPELTLLEQKLRPNIDTDFQPWEREIKELLSRTLIREYYGEDGLSLYSLRQDAAFRAASTLLLDLPRYHRLLGGIPEP